MDKLVSIITPCYNGEKYLDRYFTSILEQTYPSVELIFVNDGSTDGTERIALEYGEKLKAKGYGFTYICQENAGQSAAINQGLRIFKGEYLNWTDSDDYLTPDSVEKRVRFLEENPEIGLVIGSMAIVDDVNYNHISLFDAVNSNRLKPREIIEDYLQGVLVNPCGSSMVRSSMLRDSMNGVMQIEAPREIGQNYQLYIPILFNYPVAYVPDILGYYVVHDNSHSHSKKTFEQKLHIQDVATETLKSIAGRIKADETDREWFLRKIEEYDGKNRLDILQHHRRSDGLKGIIDGLKSIGAYDKAARKMVLKIRYPFLKKISDRLWRLRRR
ncbi:MAG: glycosyltransferase family 2 protein [Bacteroidales bacterium]|nr:glycosyltransferase family 2 protein [Bacteroidales bacterium]